MALKIFLLGTIMLSEIATDIGTKPYIDKATAWFWYPFRS